MPSIARTLQLAPIACYLSANNVAKKSGLFGGTVDPTNPTKIYNVYKILKKIYDYDPDYDGLQARCDYLYELMKRWALAAAAIADGGGGGEVSPVTPPSLLYYDFQVNISSSFIIAGETTKQLPSTWIGRTIIFFRNYIPQSQVVLTDNAYYSWDSGTAILSLFGPAPANGAAQVTEIFQIYPVQ